MYRILFCDDLPQERKGFMTHVYVPLKDKIEIEPDYARSLDDEHPEKNVKQLIEEDGKEYDIVVTDLNFSAGLSGLPAHDFEGLRILRYLKEEKQMSVRPLLITMYADTLKGFEDYAELERLGLPYWLTVEKEAESSSPRTWEEVRQKLMHLFDDIDEKRELEARKPKEVPKLYDITLIYKDLFESNMGVIVRRKRLQYQIAFTLNKKRSVTFWTLTQSPPIPLPWQDLFNRIKALQFKDSEVVPIETMQTIIEKCEINLKQQHPQCVLENRTELCKFAKYEKAVKDLKKGEPGYQCARKLGLCVKLLAWLSPLNPGRNFTKEQIKGHIAYIRRQVDEQNEIFLKLNPTVARHVIHCEHSSSIDPKLFCAKCLIYTFKSGGYTLTADLQKSIRIEDDKDFEKVLEHFRATT